MENHMPLPSLENLTVLELLRLVDNPEGNSMLFVLNRIAKGEALENKGMTQEELRWVVELGLRGYVLKDALEELSPDEIIALWASKYPKPKKPGKPPDIIYVAAWAYHKSTNKKLTTIYREIVLPELIKREWIKTDANGTPDPDEVEAARVAYLKAMARMRK
jgi:hypothetical protein